MSFITLYAAVVSANLTTVAFVYLMLQASKMGEETPAWVYFGATACLLIAAASVYAGANS